MSKITKILGKRIRNYRTARGLSQEGLAELCGCHPTYVGQIERGEKNATIESIEKLSVALGVSLSRLFENLGTQDQDESNISTDCYELLLQKTREEQEQLYRVLLEIDGYKNK